MKRGLAILLALLGTFRLLLDFFVFATGLVQGEVVSLNPGTIALGFALLLPGLWLDGVLKTLWTSLRRTVADLPVLFPLILFVGGVGHLLMWKLGPIAVPWRSSQDQWNLFLLTLGESLVGLVWAMATYPLIWAAAIFCWQARDRGETTSFGAAWAFARARYRRMFRPHAKAYFAIFLGMLVVVPGIVYGLWFAFADPITATDDRSKEPLSRSRKLTQGRRGRLLRSWLPYAIWISPLMFLPGFVQKLEGMGALVVVSWGVIDIFLLTVMKMSMFSFYEQRIEEARAARVVREADEAPAEHTPGE
jgi:hypothetical protein